MEYSKPIFFKWRRLAITQADQIQIGREYYTNTTTTSFRVFRVLQVLTERGRAAKEQMIQYLDTGKFDKTELDCVDNQKLRWMFVEFSRSGELDRTFKSLQDLNIGASYNPWLMFDREDLAAQCRQQLIITWPKLNNWNI